MAKRKKSKSAKPKEPEEKLNDSVVGAPPRILDRSPEVLYRQAEIIFEKYAEKLLKLPGVESVDLGMKIRRKNSTRQFAIRVHVLQKIPQNLLKEDELIPEMIEGIPTDIIVRNYVAGAADSSPLKGGQKIAPKTSPGSFGTVGIDVICNDQYVRLLTCAHVVSKQHPITHPISMVGTTLTSTETLKSYRSIYNNLVDCALIDPQLPRHEIIGIPYYPPLTIDRATADDIYYERSFLTLGAVTGTVSTGVITSITSRPMRINDGIGTTIQNHIQIRPESPGNQFIARGDSGALLVSPDGRAVGLIRGVDESTGDAVACHLVDVAVALDIDVQ